MAEQLSPSIKTTRQKSGSPTIAGVATGTGGFIGEAQKGPANLPQLITSMVQFKTVFGNPISGSSLYASVDGFFKNGGARCYVSRVIHYSSLTTPTTTAARSAKTFNDSIAAASVKVEAINEGAWGDELSITTLKEDTLITTIVAGVPAAALLSFLAVDASLLTPGDLLKIDDGVGTPVFCVVQSISGNTVTVVTGTTATIQAANTKLYLATFSLTTLDKDGRVLQKNTGLRMSELSLRGYFTSKVNVDGSVIRVTDLSGAGDVNDDRPANSTAGLLAGNNGGTVVDADVIGNAANFLGLNSFDKVDDVKLLSAPGWTAALTQLAGSQYCGARGDIYWVSSGPAGMSPAAAKTYKTVTANLAKQETGFYYPLIKIIDPITGVLIAFTPDGHIQGAIARTDKNRGVGKVAAGIEDGLLVGALGVEYEVGQGEYDVLYPVGINCILPKKNAGICIFGSRNTYLGGDYPQQNQIRSVQYVESSLFEGSAWVNFENSGPELWARIRRSFISFLRSARRDKVLKGPTDAEAFYVICDLSNNPPSQQNAGKVKARVGLAVQTPGEFFEIEIERDTRALDAELAGG